MLIKNLDRAAPFREAFLLAIIDWYDCVYSKSYMAHEIFMLETFGYERSKTAYGLLERFVIERVFKVCSPDTLFVDSSSTYKSGNIEMKLLTDDGRVLVIDWLYRYGPIHAYWYEFISTAAQ